MSTPASDMVNNLSVLSHELISSILEKTDASTLFRVSAVCKVLRDTINWKSYFHLCFPNDAREHGNYKAAFSEALKDLALEKGFTLDNLPPLLREDESVLKLVRDKLLIKVLLRGQIHPDLAACEFELIKKSMSIEKPDISDKEIFEAYFHDGKNKGMMDDGARIKKKYFPGLEAENYRQHFILAYTYWLDGMRYQRPYPSECSPMGYRFLSPGFLPKKMRDNDTMMQVALLSYGEIAIKYCSERIKTMRERVTVLVSESVAKPSCAAELDSPVSLEKPHSFQSVDSPVFKPAVSTRGRIEEDQYENAADMHANGL